METPIGSALVSPGDRVGIVQVDGTAIAIKGNDNSRMAVRELSKFGLITFSRDYTFKNTKYSLHFIKPVQKLRQLYNLGDEVLIMCCSDNFTEFKSRTKDCLDLLLTSKSEYRNRLDKITCFLCDDCVDLAELVKQDRTENPDSRLIVPFSYEEIKRGISDDQFQSRMREFLYERDLFGVASPLQNDNLFYGKDRTNVISELYGKYLQGEHGGLFGLRRIGKTSILNLLQRRVEQSDGVAMYFDCTKYNRLRWNSFLQQIIREIIAKYSVAENSAGSHWLPQDFKLDPTDADYSEEWASLTFEKDLKKLYNALGSVRILLIFDEIEEISYETSPSAHWRSGTDALFFWQTLRSISQSDQSLFSFIVTGVNPKCIESSKIAGGNNPIFNGLTPQYVTLFNFDDVKAMVSDIGGHLGLSFEEEIYAKLVDDYGGHPFLTRQVCSRLNNDALAEGKIRPLTISKYTYEAKSDDYKIQMAAVIAQILGVLEDYYPEEYELLKTLAIEGSGRFKRKLGFGDSSISHLLGYCLIHKEEDNYFIRINSIAEYLRTKYDYNRYRSGVDERIAFMNDRIRSLERRLRALIMTNIKLKYGRKAKEHLMDAVRKTSADKAQETRMMTLDLQGTMEELYLPQLRLLILKNWDNYQAIFLDKNKFIIYSDEAQRLRILLAHHKEIDEQDELQLKLVMKYFDDCLQ